MKVRKIREIKNVSQSYLADKLSISQSAYSDLENGKTRITEQKLKEIAAILKVTPEIIEGYSDSVVFNSCTQSGNKNILYLDPLEKIDKLYNQLIEQQSNQIKALEETIRVKNKLIEVLENLGR